MPQSFEAILFLVGIALAIFGILGRKIKRLRAGGWSISTEPLDRWQRIVLAILGFLLIAIAVLPILGITQPLLGVTATKTATVTPTATSTSTPTFTPLPTSTLTPTKTPTPPTPVCMLEDFESGRQMNWWSPDPAVFFDFRETSELAHSGTQSFKVKYSKSDTYQFMGAELPADSCDFARGRTLQMWVHGKVTLLLKLEDQSLRQFDISEQRVTEATGWTPLIFDYTAAGSALDLSRIKSILLFPAPGDPSASGEIFLDDIAVFP